MKVAVTGDASGSFPSRTAEWIDGFSVEPPGSERLRAVHWARQAATAASARAQSTSSDAFATWTAAVEGVWWVAALDDILDQLVGATRYRSAREADDFGRVVLGLRWLRHLHIHELAVSGAGGPKRPFFPPPGAGYIFYISPSNRWLRSDELIPREGERNPALRAAYDAAVAGLPLSMAIDQATVWHDRVMSACGLPPYVEPDDATIL